MLLSVNWLPLFSVRFVLFVALFEISGEIGGIGELPSSDRDLSLRSSSTSCLSLISSASTSNRRNCTPVSDKGDGIATDSR